MLLHCKFHNLQKCIQPVYCLAANMYPAQQESIFKNSCKAKMLKFCAFHTYDM